MRRQSRNLQQRGAVLQRTVLRDRPVHRMSARRRELQRQLPVLRRQRVLRRLVRLSAGRHLVRGRRQRLLLRNEVRRRHLYRLRGARHAVRERGRMLFRFVPHRHVRRRSDPTADRVLLARSRRRRLHDQSGLLQQQLLRRQVRGRLYDRRQRLLGRHAVLLAALRRRRLRLRRLRRRGRVVHRPRQLLQRHLRSRQLHVILW